MDTRKRKRQQYWQKRQREQGNCHRCGNPSPERVLCNDCATRQGTAKRHLLPSDWEKVDWNLSAKEIAAQLGVSVGTVYYNRNKRGRK